jgi:glycosyltransferase involved in cell wall biosynthesis
MINFSIIIPSYNSYNTLDRTLKSIFRLKSFERVKDVIVVDSSDDGKTRELLRDSSPSFYGTQRDSHKLNIILLDQKTSPALGRNIGAKHAQEDILCFIDSDVYLDDEWLENIIQAYESGCKAGCGSVSVPDFQQNSKLAMAQLYLQFNESLNAGEKRLVAMVPACNMFVDKVLFERAGSFPDIRASEDVLLCLKLGEFTKIWFVPKAKCFHIFRESFSSYFNNQKVLGKYIMVYRRMTYNKWYYKGLWPVLMLPVFLLIKITRIKFRIFKAGWGHYKRFFISSPLFLAGLWYWAVGFLEGCGIDNMDEKGFVDE